MKRDKTTIRAALAASHQIDFTADVFTLSHSQRVALVDAAKACGYRKSITSCLTLGGAFFQYLAKGAIRPMSKSAKVGGRWNNDGVAR